MKAGCEVHPPFRRYGKPKLLSISCGYQQKADWNIEGYWDLNNTDELMVKDSAFSRPKKAPEDSVLQVPRGGI